MSEGLLALSTEVTQAQFASMMATNPTRSFLGCGPEYPVSAGWEDAVRFANKLSRSQGLDAAYRRHRRVWVVDPAKEGYRLPSTREWVDTLFGGPNAALADSELCDWGNVDDEGRYGGDGPVFNLLGPDGTVVGTLGPAPCVDAWQWLSPVKAHPAWRTGLFGLVGNVGEWVDDGEQRLARSQAFQVAVGGSIGTSSWTEVVATRELPPNATGTGFRLVRPATLASGEIQPADRQ